MGHTQGAGERIIARVCEAEADRAKDCNERPIRGAIQQHGTQVQVEQDGRPGDEQIVIVVQPDQEAQGQKCDSQIQPEEGLFNHQ